ncbi:transcriptional regulator [Mangrovivirga cuniculi]|uniref:Transcriptional regulator n=1 Tax=Mangrovivirga cuniculi TaxID=2715131 RepID=A0A4D7K7Q9_9BACT|nr:transcriptional regulator [Mangrovivirga cuniculi]QCK15378.1 transcriptional regulator [Mangrovivirga cuniculi]
MTGIITGDIIRSGRDLSNPKWLEILKTQLSTLSIDNTSWDIYSGDSFQLEVNPADGLTTMLLIKSLLIFKADINVRMALGIGEKEYSGDSISESNGEAFVYSGRLLDELKTETLAIRSSNQEFDETINLMIDLGLLTIDRWTQNSAEAVYYFLSNEVETQKQLADKLGISQGRISERLSRAGYDQIIKLDHYYRKYFNQNLHN